MASKRLIFAWAVWLALPLATGHLNVLISQAEVMKLLGLDAELYYVREGVVNTYATGFIVPVPAHITDLEFMWQALGRKPLPYVISIDYESRGAMLPPQVNISERGYVPTTLQTFRVRLPCTGSRSAEILVTMQLNISAPDRAHKDVRLVFKRNKICLKGLSTIIQHNDTARLAGDASSTSGGVLFAAGGCAAAALALLAGVAAAGTLYRRGNKARHHDSIHTSYTTAAYGSHQNVLLRLDTLGRPPSSTGSYATIASLHKFPFGDRKLCPRWITHTLTDDQKHLRMNWCRQLLDKFDGDDSNAIFDIVIGVKSWIYYYEPKPKDNQPSMCFVTRTGQLGRSQGEKMIASFFGGNGHFAIVVLEDRRTVTAEWYVNCCLSVVLEKIRQQHPRSRILLHHDNASVHTEKCTVEYFTVAGVEIMSHPPYRYDLAPWGFNLFPRFKDKIQVIRFTSPEHVVKAYENALEEITKEEWAHCFSERFHRMRRCQTIAKDRITEPADQLRYLTTPRSNIRLEILVQEGTFGRVYKGVFKRGDTYEEVLVKTVSDAASAMQAALLLAEGLRLCGLVHCNVLTPMAACAEEARKPLLVYCCVSHSSNLKRFLTSCRLGHQAAPATRELVDLGAQIACGLAYLHVQRVIHTDVATRNCIVDEKLRLRITDNGLSRDLFPDDYHCLGDNENRPVKWMAPESLLQGQCTTSSDVWSLGITLWELATLGAAPLSELDAADVGAFLNGGYRPSQPHNCPDELYGLMSWCWTTSPSARPTAPQLLAALHDFRQALSTYI
nr:tyrosine-protein kinase Dnt-like [Danaus plexippus plexippus]